MFIETKLRRISNMRPQTSPQERRSVLRLLRCTLSTVLLLQIHTRHQRPWRSPTRMLLNGNASARNTTNIIRYIEYTKGSIDYYNSLHSGFPPPVQEETENGREDNEDVEDKPARKSSRHEGMITGNMTYCTYFCFYNFDYVRNHTFGINIYNIYACLHTDFTYVANNANIYIYD